MIKLNIMSKPEDLLYNWLFHYNTYTNKWNAFRREDMSNYFNGTAKIVIREETHQVCIEQAAVKELELRGTI